MSELRIILLTNSPGELATWVAPIVAEIHRTRSNWEIIVALTPCQYASGQEARVARELPGVRTVWTPAETRRILWRGCSWEKKNTVLWFLGGDPFFAWALGIRLHAKRVALANRGGFPNWMFDVVFGPENGLRLLALHMEAGGRGDSLRESGPAEPSSPESALPDPGPAGAPDPTGSGPAPPARLRLAFFPGSRPQHFQYLLPFFLETVGCLHQNVSGLEVHFPISPFIAEATADMAIQSIQAAGGIVSRDSKATLRRCDVVVTIPGSNTAEAMLRDKPMVVVIPFNYPEVFQFDGLLGLIGQLPVIGKWVKLGIAWAGKLSGRRVALPNMLPGGRDRVPEWSGVMTPDELATKLAHYLSPFIAGRAPHPRYPKITPFDCAGALRRIESLVDGRITIFFDGKCGICAKEMAHYQRISPPNRFNWIDITTIGDAIKNESFTLDAGLRRLHVKDAAGQLHCGVDAFIMIWNQLPRWRSLAMIGSLPGIHWLAGWAYNRFAEWRYKRMGYCTIPE